MSNSANRTQRVNTASMTDSEQDPTISNPQHMSLHKIHINVILTLKKENTTWEINVNEKTSKFILEVQ
jgi:hypothetical protein